MREKCEIKKASVHAGLRAKSFHESLMLSSQGRYNHFDTAPYVCCSLSIIAGTGSKIKEIFRRFTCV